MGKAQRHGSATGRQRCWNMEVGSLLMSLKLRRRIKESTEQLHKCDPKQPTVVLLETSNSTVIVFQTYK